jgi:hypothetical protein
MTYSKKKPDLTPDDQAVRRRLFAKTLRVYYFIPKLSLREMPLELAETGAGTGIGTGTGTSGVGK